MKKMLIVDDNKQITAVLNEYSRMEGYEPILAYDGEEAMAKFNKESPDVILLDVMLPKKNGFNVCKEIRNLSTVPILMITARGEDFDKIMGLDVGADDYIVKPLSAEEVMARVRAVFRRIDWGDNNELSIFRYGDLIINLNDYSVFVGKESVPITKKEFELLWLLAPNANIVFSRETLLDTIWGNDYFGDSRIVNKHICRLRVKLESATDSKMTIAAIRGRGYKFEVNDDVEK